MIENDLDDIGIEEFTQVPDRNGRLSPSRFRRIRKQGRHRTYQPGSIIGSSPDVDDQTVRRSRALDNLRDPIGAGGVVPRVMTA